MGENIGNNRVETQSRILLDGVELSFNANYSQRNSTQDYGGVNDFAVLVGVTASQVLTVETRHVGTTNDIIVASIFIRKLDT